MIRFNFKHLFTTLYATLLLSTSPHVHSELSHGFAMHGDLKYPENFTHFDYVNPNAPKGGTLKQAVRANSFDSLNPFIVKGVSAAGVSYLYQSLTAQSADEAFSEYALIAEKIDLAEDRSEVTFHINPKAKFSDGKPITAEDIKFSFEALTQHERARPFYGAYYADVAEVIIASPLVVTFKMKDDKNKELPLILGQMPILAKHYWEKADFGTASLDIPVTNGPYKVKSIDAGRSITYERDPNYWAKDLPVNVGRYNFDELVYEYYSDNTVALEAFKAGEYDFRTESTARNWANSYTGNLFDKGVLVKEEVVHHRPTGLQAFAINSRKDKFSNPKVREALGLAFDFEWANQNLFYGQYQRAKSYFENSELASSGLPKDEELEILSQFNDQLPEELFTQAYVVPSTEKPNSIRSNLRKATALLNEAGLNVVEGKRMFKGKQLKLEFLIFQKDFERVIQPFIKNLNRLGIAASISVVDSTQYVNRLRAFDFDLVVTSFGQSDSPGNEQTEYWHSSKADQEGSRNFAGVSSPVVDKLVDLVINAPNRESLIQRTRALDRVLLWGHYVIPNWFNPVDRIAYRNTLTGPKMVPKSGVQIDAWWVIPSK